jgi:Arc/MetJ-type ribon-helix-helix transcriptional regulator
MSLLLFLQAQFGGTLMKLITLHLPEPYIMALDRLVKEKYYPNRAEAIRVAVRDLLNVEAWGKKNNG